MGFGPCSKRRWGVGFGSLDAMNQSLLYKWRWRALVNPQSTWAKVIAAIHGRDCFTNMSAINKGLWFRIAQNALTVHNNITSGQDILMKRVGNGQSTYFWNDIWCGTEALKIKFPRLAALDMDSQCKVSDRWNTTDWNWQWRRPIRSNREHAMVHELYNILPRALDNMECDKWVWKKNGKADFHVSILRKLIDHALLPTVNNIKTKWNALVPKKVNIFIWRLRRDAIPTFINLFAKGIDVDSFRCPQCDHGVEWTGHTFQCCNYFVDTRNLLRSWLKLNIPMASPENVLAWCDTIKLSVRSRLRLEAILFTWWWFTWKSRNNKVHNDTQESSSDMFGSIVSMSFLWITNRDRKCNIKWDEWIEFPLNENKVAD